MKGIVVLAAWALLAVSCTVDYGTGSQRNPVNLKYKAMDLVDLSAEYSVTFLYDNCARQNLSAGEELSSSENFGDGLEVEYDFVGIADGVWEVSLRGEMVDCVLTVSRETGAAGEEIWKVAPFVLDYDEGNGCSAVLSTSDDVLFGWVYTQGYMSSPSWSLRQSGKYSFTTFIDGKEGDCAELVYREGEVSGSADMVY